MLSERDIQYIHWRNRHDQPLIRPLNLPAKAFDIETLPYPLKLENEEERIVFPRALSITREWGEKIWMEKTNRLSKEDRKNFQIVVIRPRHAKTGNGDFSASFYDDVSKENFLGTFPPVLFNRKEFDDDELEYGKNIGRNLNEQRSVKSVYIVSSAVSDEELCDIRAVAKRYKESGTVEVNLIAPFIKDEREDKNIGITENNKKGKYNGRLIKIEDVMEDLAASGIDRIVTFEPHSSATQAFAAIHSIALAPISLEEELIGEIKNQIIKDRKNWVVVRPDAGRNLVTRRIEKYFDIKGIHLEKLRDSETGETMTNNLTEREEKALFGKNTILYDDEGGTLGTIRNIIMKKFIPAKVASINIFMAHARLQKKWKTNLDEIIKQAKEHNIPIKIYFSDSRKPLGNLASALKEYEDVIKVISVNNKVKKVINACTNGVNFWVNKGQEGVDWERSILQAVSWFDDKEYSTKLLKLQKSKRN